MARATASWTPGLKPWMCPGVAWMPLAEVVWFDRWHGRSGTEPLLEQLR